MNDLKFAFRQLLKNPGFTTVAVLTLALGIGATTAIYSTVHSVLLHPIPGSDSERLMQIAEHKYDQQNKPIFAGVSPPVLRGLRANQEFFADLAWSDTTWLDRKTEDFLDSVPGAEVSPNFFSFLNARPKLGRTFAEEEATPGQDSVIILGETFCKSLFRDGTDALGKTVELGGRHYTVIGVMPPTFRFPWGNVKFWVPSEDPPDRMASPNYRVYVRLKPGTTLQRTQAIADTVAKQVENDPSLHRAYRDAWSRLPGGLLLWVRPLRDEFVETAAGVQNLPQTLFGLLGAIGFVLLIACANIANLMLAKAETRQQELAVRAALGAGRIRLMRQLLTESVLLSGLGGLGGLIVTVGGIHLLVNLVPFWLPRLKEVPIDAHALLTTVLISLGTGLLFGLAPAFRAGRTSVSQVLKLAGPGPTVGAGWRRYRSALVVGEVALALVLLSGAGLMIQSVFRLLHVNPGFDPENLLRVNVRLPLQTYGMQLDRKNALFAQLHERLATLPGVNRVGLVKPAAWDVEVQIDGREEPVRVYPAGCGVEQSDMFRAMRIPMLAGRYFDNRDIGKDIGAVIINETMARLCWPGENALGKAFVQARGNRTYEVVGVVGDARVLRYDQTVLPTFYRPEQEFDVIGVAAFFAVRAHGDPQALIPAIRKELKAAEPAMRPPTVVFSRQALYDATEARRTFMLYLVLFAGVGLLLSALGIAGVLAYSVARRTREIGIRMAVGAERRHVLSMVMSEGARLVGLGVVVGLLASFWLTRLLQSQLFEISPTEPVIFAGVVLILTAIALLACFLPAQRASKVDPMEALRYE